MGRGDRERDKQERNYIEMNRWKENVMNIEKMKEGARKGNEEEDDRGATVTNERMHKERRNVKMKVKAKTWT